MFKAFKRNKRITRARSLPRNTTGHFTLASETKRGIAIVVLFTVALISLFSFFQATGTVGIYITGALAKIFGWGDFLFPIMLLAMSYLLLRPGRYDIKLINYIGLALTVLGYSGLLHLPVRELPLDEIIVAGKGGGYIGYAIGNSLYQLMAFWGSFVVLFAIFAIGAFIFFNTSFASIAGVWQAFANAVAGYRERRSVARSNKRENSTPVYASNFKTSEIADAADDTDEPDEPAPQINLPFGSKKVSAQTTVTKPAKRAPQPKIDLPLDLLTSSNDMPASGDIKANMKKIEATLKSFGIDVTMGEVNVGPTVTQYTLKPLEGVKLTQISSLQNDLSLALAAHPLRIEAPIPGKSLVGIEVPNQSVSIVKLKEILQSQAYTERRSNLMLALGKDVTGKTMMADLAKMPHLLIAGATGSGKSVCINAMLVSLLYQNSPDLLKLILVDPKRVELSGYDGIPHLLCPVIIDTEKTINALRWAVNQMDERYKMLAAAGKKNIQAYNDARLVEPMPYIVIVIDELADLMMVAAKEVEAAIIRLAQMARAVGIHLILATQRPSVNVITGLIKANITSRIAFSVASVTDSRTIIDSSGAEKLLGNGDMLYISAELSKPKRMQGAYLSDKEITGVTDYLKSHGEPQYQPEVTERKSGHVGGGSNSGFESDSTERDLSLATEVVVKAKRASATLLQSRMRVGFAKAARILDLLEERGIVGPQNSSKPREVLITQEELDQQYAEQGRAEYGDDAPTEERINEDDLYDHGDETAEAENDDEMVDDLDEEEADAPADTEQSR